MPVHFIPHLVHYGGWPAGAGVLLGLFLGWPRLEESTGDAATGNFAITYENMLGGSGMTQEGAFGVMVGAALGFGLIGLAAAGLLIAIGVLRKEDTGGEAFK
jgi:hypothetical protein